MLFKLQFLLFLLVLLTGSLKASESEKNTVRSFPRYALVVGEKSEDDKFLYLTLKLTKYDKSEPDVSRLTFSLFKDSTKVIDLQSLYPQNIYQKSQPSALTWFMSKEQSIKLSAKAKYPVKAIVLKIKKSMIKDDSKTYSVEIEDVPDTGSAEKNIQSYPISLK